MPQLIRTPEQIMRAEPKDLYFIEFASPSGECFPLDPLGYQMSCDFSGSAAETDDNDVLSEDEDDSGSDDDNPPGREELLAWLAENLPQLKIESLAPSERSGILCGGINGRLRLDFDEHSLPVYTQRWEDGDDNPLDPRFACFVLRYETMKDRLEPLEKDNAQ